MLLPGRYHIVIRLVGLQHQPHTFHIVPGIAPVPFRAEVPQVQLVLVSGRYPAGRQSDLPRDESLAPPFALVVEQDSVYSEHPVAFTVVLRDPESVQLGHPVRGTRIERSRLFLRSLLDKSEQFGSRCLVYPDLFLHSENPHGLEQAQSPHGIGLGRVFRHIETYLDVALRREIVYLVRPDCLYYPYQRTAVGHIPPMQVDKPFLLHIPDPFVKV